MNPGLGFRGLGFRVIITLGKIGDYEGVPFFGSFRGSGIVSTKVHSYSDCSA